MSLVSVTQIEQQQPSQQNDMSWNTEPRMCAVERVHLQPLSATAMTNFHPGFTYNMEEEALTHDNHPLATFGNIAITENCSQEQSSPNTQLGDKFHAEEEALAHDHNLASNQNFQVGTLDDDPTMHHNQMYSMYFQPSSTVISGNHQAFVSQNCNFGMNMDHGSQPIQQGEAIVDEYSTEDSIYRPQFQNASLPSGAFRSQNSHIVDKFC